ncbi:60S ribosomal protein L18a-1-like [Nymphaea colorata]|nr:60S ribosomal protein L18a-1-like [Nymphaea colorata]
MNRSHSLYPNPSSRGFLRLSSSSCPSLPPTIFASSARQSTSFSSQYSLIVFPVINIKRLSKILAVVEEKSTVETSVPEESMPETVEEALPRESRPFKLYVCNLPESTDVAELSELFKPYGSVLSVEIFEKNPTKIKNYGIWLRYQSRTGYHNMYKEYRDTTPNGVVEQMYDEMASRHRVGFPRIQIIKTATVPAKLCKRESTKQFNDSKIKFPLVYKKVRSPTRKLKTTFKASRPNLFM